MFWPMNAALEVSIEREAGGVSVRAYTDVFNQLLRSLEELDRVAVPGRARRFDWAIRTLNTRDRNLIAVLTPRSMPLRRADSEVFLTTSALTAGVAVLRDQPMIPELFTETTVTRIA